MRGAYVEQKTEEEDKHLDDACRVGVAIDRGLD